MDRERMGDIVIERERERKKLMVEKDNGRERDNVLGRAKIDREWMEDIVIERVRGERKWMVKKRDKEWMRKE